MRFIPIPINPPEAGHSYLTHKNRFFEVFYLTHEKAEKWGTFIYSKELIGREICMTPLSVDKRVDTGNPNQMTLPFAEEN